MSVKIKTNESLFFTLPAIYKYYYEKNGINYNENLSKFISWLLKAKKNFIVVFDDEKQLNRANKHFTFENSLNSKFNRFQNVANIVPSVVEKSLFEKEYLYENFDRMDLPAYITGDYFDFLS